MDVKLPDHIAERPGVDLGTARDPLQRLRDHVGLEGQHGLVKRRQVVDFLDLGALRYQHQPGPASVVHHAQFAKPKPQQLLAVGFEPGIERKSGLQARQHGRPPEGQNLSIRSK